MYLRVVSIRQTVNDWRRVKVTEIHVSHCCARQGGYEPAGSPALVRGYFNGPPLWICRYLITEALNPLSR